MYGRFLTIGCLATLLMLGCESAQGVFPLPQPTILPGASPPQPTNVAARHRSGQTFITWSERTDLTGESYRVYRLDQPITRANLSQALQLYEVPEGSARFFANRYRIGSTDWENRYLERHVIDNASTELAEGTGLLVWTLAPEDFDDGDSGDAYYAVTTMHNGTENLSDFSAANTTGPVAETIDDPLPVEVVTGLGSGWHVFIQYMDLRRWNPTFHAPNETNDYYGLDPNDPEVSQAIQYAYDYTVLEPGPAACGTSIPATAPVILTLHGFLGNTYEPGAEAPNQCAYMIFPIDMTETWWFGFARNHDYRRGGRPTTGDTIVNYTEQRVLRMIYDLIRNPGGPMVDTNRIYINGHSMGGSGSLALALRYPNVFAAAYASKPMTNYRTDSDWETDNVKPKWGNPEQNLPVLIEGPGDWADHLQVYNGTGVWDWQNHQAHLQNRQGDEMVPFGIVHGINDDNIRWDTQGRPAYTALNASRRAWGGLVTDNEHDWVPYQGVPPNLRRDAFLDPFVGLRVVRNETVPGLSNSSNNLAIPPATTGGFNQTLLWSSSWTPWDGPPVDTPVRWQISLCSISADPSINDCGTGAPQTVDVTPRRVQHFVIRAGMTYRWENRRVRDGELVASGQVTADSNGVLTVPNFQVSPAGNRLIISPVSVVHNYLPMIFRY